MKYLMSQEVAQAILNYLTTRPYREVHQLVSEMAKLERMNDDKAKPEAKKS